MAFDSIGDWLIIAVVVGILFFGATKIPTLARSLGRSIGEFKRGRLEVEQELKNPPAHPTSPPPSTTQVHP